MSVSELIHSLMLTLPLRNAWASRAELPANGIYVFYEQGEVITTPGGVVVVRIVRVGTHKTDGRFTSRIRNHYGNISSLGGNRHGSIFRKHLGSALIRRQDQEDPILHTWLLKSGSPLPDWEEAVSRELRQQFTFRCFPVQTKDDRLQLEAALIATLAREAAYHVSSNWLG